MNLFIENILGAVHLIIVKQIQWPRFICLIEYLQRIYLHRVTQSDAKIQIYA